MSGGWTRGEWFRSAPYGFVCAKNDLSTLVVADVSGRTRDEIEANSQLLLEAGTVANETGLSPRQLADQRAELLAALKCMLSLADDAERYLPYSGTTRGDITQAARIAIAKAEGIPS